MAQEVATVAPHGRKRPVPAGLFREDGDAPVLFPTDYPSIKRMRALRFRQISSPSSQLPVRPVCASTSQSGVSDVSDGSFPSYHSPVSDEDPISVTVSDCYYGPKYGPVNRRPTRSGKFSLSTIPGRPAEGTPTGSTAEGTPTNLSEVDGQNYVLDLSCLVARMRQQEQTAEGQEDQQAFLKLLNKYGKK